MKEYNKKDVFDTIQNIIQYANVDNGGASFMGYIKLIGIQETYGNEMTWGRTTKEQEQKAELKLAQVLLSKYNSNKPVTLSPKEIERLIINKDNRTIYNHVLSELGRLGVDMAGVCLDNLYLHGRSFRGLENVSINLDKVLGKDLIDTYFTNAKFTGSFDGFKLLDTTFEKCEAEKPIDPQKIVSKSLEGGSFDGIEFDGSFDGVSIKFAKFNGAKGLIKINPQRVKNKDISYTDLTNCFLVGERIDDTEMYEEAIFDGCKINDINFSGFRNKVTIDLDGLEANNLYRGKINCCDITGVIIKGTVLASEAKDVLCGCHVKGDDCYICLSKPETYKDNPDIQVTIVKKLEQKEEEKPKTKVKRSIFSRFTKTTK